MVFNLFMQLAFYKVKGNVLNILNVFGKVFVLIKVTVKCTGLRQQHVHVLALPGLPSSVP